MSKEAEVFWCVLIVLGALGFGYLMDRYTDLNPTPFLLLGFLLNRRRTGPVTLPGRRR